MAFSIGDKVGYTRWDGIHIASGPHTISGLLDEYGRWHIDGSACLDESRLFLWHTALEIGQSAPIKNTFCGIYLDSVPRLGHYQEEACAICFASNDETSLICQTSNSSVSIMCGHSFHKLCLSNWLMSKHSLKRCPMCNTAIIKLAPSLL